MQVDMEDVRMAQEAALANVMDAVESGLGAKSGSKRTALGQQPAAAAKKRRVFDLAEELSSDEEDDSDKGDAVEATAGASTSLPLATYDWTGESRDIKWSLHVAEPQLGSGLQDISPGGKMILI